MRTIRSTPDGRPAPPTTLKPDGSARTRVRAAHPIDAALGIDALPKLSAPSTAEIMWRELAPRTPRERAFSVASPRLANALKRAGWFSGKSRTGSGADVGTVLVFGDEHGFAVHVEDEDTLREKSGEVEDPTPDGP